MCSRSLIVMKSATRSETWPETRPETRTATILETSFVADQVIDELKDFILDGPNIAIVKAPPGSGKTYTLVESLDVAVRSGMRVMVAAQTNNQVDEICERIAERYPTPAVLERRVVRFSSGSYVTPSGTNADGATFTDLVDVISTKADLPDGACVIVSTVSKLALSEFEHPFDLLYVDEAWQMAWADFLPLRHVAERYILIGDPGQIPPTVAIEVDRWEATDFPPHAPAPDLLLRNPRLRELRSEFRLPTCRRLPYDSVELVNSFYDFTFGADASPGERFIRVGGGVGGGVGGDVGGSRSSRATSSHTTPHATPHVSKVDEALARMWAGDHPLTTAIITHPTPDNGMPVGTDTELAEVVVDIVLRILELECEISTQPAECSKPRRLVPQDIGIVSTHNLMNAAISRRLASGQKKSAKNPLSSIRATTPERWQGLERPVMIAVHPLSGVMSPSEFDLETGRLCVMASRHRSACFFVTRDHIAATLDAHLPSATQALGGVDVTGRGHDVHRDFIDYHLERNLVV